MPDRTVDFLLIGGGIASANCAATLRERGAQGSILLVGRESDPPYDRPPCSKEYLRGEQSREDAYVHPPEFYAEHEIELLTRVSAMKLDPAARTVRLSNREEVAFDKALIATGAGVRRLDVDGARLEGIQYLRTFGNADAIRAEAEGKQVVLIGGSYIGCEVAASLTELGARATIVMLEPVVLSRGFGEQAGRFFQRCLEEHGVTIHGGEEVAGFEGQDGRVRRVRTASGLTVEADLVVIGAGAVPDTTLAKAAGLELGESGGVRVDSQLQTSIGGIFAAGDIAEYRSVVHDGRPMRVEHWDVAVNQGRFAARNMLGDGVDYDVVPYFFSDLADWASLEYVGPASDWDEEVIRGSIGDGAFSVWYVAGDRIAAALSVERSDDLEHARRLIRSGEPPRRSARELADLSADLSEF